MYGGFAKMYDGLMTDAPYELWAAYIDGLLSEWFKNSSPLVLDLACGTGNITLRLAEKGYDLIGVDSSEDMLAEAQRKAYEEGHKILFLAQDMRELDLYGTIDAAVCVCDGMNYILKTADLLEVFRRVRLFLNPGGVFIFDMNTEYKFNEVLKNSTFEDKSADGSYVWQNNYNPETKINEYHMFFYSPDEDEPFTELHKQRAYPPADIINLLMEAGFSAVSTRNSYSADPIQADSTRIVFIAAV